MWAAEGLEEDRSGGGLWMETILREASGAACAGSALSAGISGAACGGRSGIAL